MVFSIITVRKLLFPLLIGLVLCWVFFGVSDMPWAGFSLRHPLGTDEFGRDVLATVLAAAGFSLAKGVLITLVTLAAAVIAAELVTLRYSPAASILIRTAANIVESVPVVLWVFIAIIAVQGPRLIVVGSAFALVVFPIATHVLAGEFLRLRSAFYVESAYLLGAGELRVLIRYILPNAMAVLLPFALQILGAAIAVDGAFGVIGLGNRSNLDLGVFLLRGKENFLQHPQILIVTLVMYALVYGYIIEAGKIIGQGLQRTFGLTFAEAVSETAQL